jgi:hypothetical protein
MRRILIFPFSALVGGIALSLTCAAIGGAQESPIKRTVLLETNLTDLGDKEMHVWSAISRPAQRPAVTRTQRRGSSIVLEGAVILEMDGKPPQTFKTGQAFVEPANVAHNFKNASTTEPAKALGFQYAGKGQPLQVNAP